MNDIDLFYLSGRYDFKNNKNIKNIKNDENEKIIKDVSFYKERIINQITNLLNGEKVEKSVDNCFKIYLKKSIENFKFIDKRDIIQKEYEGLVKKKEKSKNFNLEETNKLMERGKMEKIGKLTDMLDIKINNKKENKIVIPKKKIINLRDKNLKTKGLKKKI